MNNLAPESTIEDLRRRLQEEHNVADLSSREGAARQPLTLKPRSAKGGGDGGGAEGDELALTATMKSLGLSHGDMVHLHLSESIRDMAHEVRLWDIVFCLIVVVSATTNVCDRLLDCTDTGLPNSIAL